MRALSTALAALSVIAASSAAVAQDAKDAPHTSPTIPELTVKGDSTGNATLNLGLSHTKNDDRDTDSTTTISFTTKTSDGVSNLLSFDTGGTKGTDWGLQAAWSRTELEEFNGNAAAIQKARASAWNTCVQACRRGSSDLICQVERHPEIVQDAQATSARYDQAIVGLESAFLERDVASACAALHRATGADAKLVQRCDDLLAPRVGTPEPTASRIDELSALLSQLTRGPAVSIATYVDDSCKALAGSNRPDDQDLQARCGDRQQLAADRDLRQKELDDANKAIAAATVDGHPPSPITLDSVSFCADGLAMIDKAGKVYRDQRAARPVAIMSIAAEVSETKHDYLQAGTTAGTFTSQSTMDPAAGGAAELMYRFDEKGQLGRVVNTIEIPALVSFKKQPATTTAKWCVPAGNVIASDGSSTAAETCNERALGAPKSVTVLKGELLLGFEDRDNSSYRWTAGLTGSVSRQDKGKPGYAVGLTFPLYLDTNLLPDDKGVFKGIVRITPSFLWTRDLDGTTDSKFVVTVELLTGRSIYPAAATFL